MHAEQRHLPDPTKVGTNGKPGGSLESVVSVVIAPKAEGDYIQLAPILRDPFHDHSGSSSSTMLRHASISSSSSSEHSGFHLSRSGSPVTNPREPLYRQSPSMNRLAMTYGHLHHPYHIINPLAAPNQNCPSCLQAGENVPVDVGKACPQCGHINAMSKTAGKVSRRKRTDRKHYSRLGNNNAKPEKASKEEGEAGRRYDHSFWFASLQNMLLSINPDFAHVAAQGHGKRKPGWTPLKCNNVSEDVKEGSGINPLAYNKSNIFESTYQVIGDSTRIIDDVVQERETLEYEMNTLLQSTASVDELRRFLERTLSRRWASRVATSSDSRGAEGFVSPLPSRTRI
ncbi:hypothetical protein BKA66DRAFT_436737 [Pyrenochaeta sp. MPI-SDFR-AT-0127]|nr:hypothetical protein BKA66DRAFT_436737 [Pyrenochaeta sp. MPI-SDFR-AT-0127]